MRMSVKKSDQGYNKKAHLYQPYLNGKAVDRCHTADEDIGFVDIYIVDGNGEYVIDCDVIKSIRLYGNVEIKLKAVK